MAERRPQIKPPPLPAIRVFAEILGEEIWVIPTGQDKPLDGPDLFFTYEEVLKMKGWDAAQIRIAAGVRKVFGT